MTKLPTTGLEWVRQSLQDGNALAQAILRLRDVGTGTAYAAVPTGFPPSGLEHPEWGQGTLDRDGADEVLDEAVAELIGESGPQSVVVADPLMRPTDPVFARYLSESFVFRSEVYHWRRVRDGNSRVSIGGFLRMWASYPLNAVLTRSLRTYGAGEEVAPEEIDYLATSAEVVIVGAYDNEGYIVWTPDANRPLPS